MVEAILFLPYLQLGALISTAIPFSRRLPEALTFRTSGDPHTYCPQSYNCNTVVHIYHMCIYVRKHIQLHILKGYNVGI